MTKLYWLSSSYPGKVAISSRPRGDDWLPDELASWRDVGIDTVVSLLTPSEAEDLHLSQESLEAKSQGLSFISFPIVDRDVPASQDGVLKLLEQIDRKLSDGKNVVIHCRQGIGRSGVIAASVLISRGLSPGAALDELTAARGAAVPETAEQRQWLNDFAQLLSHSKS